MQYLILICKNLFIKFRKDKFDKIYFKKRKKNRFSIILNLMI